MMRRVRVRALAWLLPVLCLGAVGVVRAQDAEDPSVVLAPVRKVAPAPMVLPAPPRDADLVQIPFPTNPSMRFYVDLASLRRPDADHLRYTLVARSASGVDNVSYEEFDCPNENWRMNALWNDGAHRWDAVAAPSWIGVDVGGGGNLHAVLDTQYFCKDGSVDGDLRALSRRLRAGLHGNGEGVKY